MEIIITAAIVIGAILFGLGFILILVGGFLKTKSNMVPKGVICLAIGIAIMAIALVIAKIFGLI